MPHSLISVSVLESVLYPNCCYNHTSSRVYH